MVEIESIADTAPLPPAPSGWFDYGYTALADGRLVLIRTSKNFWAEYARWFKSRDGAPRYPRPSDGDTIRLSIFDGTAETGVVTVPSCAYPEVGQLPDGRWLVASTRADENEKNGHIYSADGQKERSILLGDGINHLLCAPDGTIWIGYFDEGIFAVHEDGSWPVSSGGIVQFDTLGKILWSFDQQFDKQCEPYDWLEKEYGHLDDAYAMTLCGNDVYACYYSGFPITRISGGKFSFWSNTIIGAGAIAVKDDIVVLVGGYGEDANRIAVVKLDGEAGRELGSLRYTPDRRFSAKHLQGIGSTLHIVNKGVWFKVEVDKIAEAIRGS